MVSSKNNLVVIGAGQMGQALMKAFTKDFLPPSNLAVYDIDEDKARSFARELGCFNLTTAELEQVSKYQIVLLAVKPQHFSSACEQIKNYAREALVLSIAAGKTFSHLRNCGFTDNELATVMPNTPALVGSGVSAVSFSDNVNKKNRALVLKLFDSCGKTYEINENLMCAATGLSGSGPAYMMLILEALADGGVRQGLPRQLAMEMAAMTMLGSARLCMETGSHPALLKDQVCSPQGTTIEALALLEEKGLRSAMIEAVKASAVRAKELADGSGDNT